jgi:hypothetical protein
MPALVQTARIVSGVEAIRATEKLRREQTHRDEWPYEHIYPPPKSKRVHQEFTLQVSAITPGTQILIGSYQVQNNFRMMFTGLVQLYIGSSAFTPGDGSIVWVLDVNNPIGVTGLVQGYPIQGFSNSGIPKGAYISGVFAPYPLAPMPEILGPLDLLSSKVTITAGITTGAFLTIFEGYLLEL